MSPPNVRLRGVRVPIPRGYVLGRSTTGLGDGQLLSIQQLRGMGVATHSDVQNSVAPLQQFVGIVADLPSPTLGARGIVTDATVTIFASVVAGGGTFTVPVYADGTNWLIG